MHKFRSQHRRRSIAAPWSEVNIEAARWEIAAERAKMRDSHVVPLSRQAVELFAALKQITGAYGAMLSGRPRPVEANE